MTSNLPQTQKTDWVSNDVVKPVDTNSWGEAINTLSKAVPIYASNGDFYTVQSYENNIITLMPLTYLDGTENETLLTYLDGMNIIFKATFTNTGECSVTVNELGIKQIKNIDNTLLKSDTITQGNYINLRYDKLQDCFYLIRSNSGGSGLELCDIGMALYVDETKGLRRYLNGQIVDINTNTQAFLNRLQEITTLHPSLLCTEEEWQTAKTMSAFGQVGKFVFNYSGNEIISVRIPAIVNVQGLFDLQNLGMTVSESLPNIKQYLGRVEYSTSSPTQATIESKAENTTFDEVSYAGDTLAYITFNANNTNSVYKDNAPVQQEAIQYPYFIQIATGSETENNIINDIELNNPYSLFECKYADHELFNLSWLVSNGSYNGSNAVHPGAYQALLVENNAEIAIGSTVTLPNGTKYTKQGLSVKLSTETYTDYDFVINSADETFRPPIKPRNLNNTRYLIEAGEQDGISYRIYADGYCEQWGFIPSQTRNDNFQVTLLKSFVDTNYNLITNKWIVTNVTTAVAAYSLYTKNKTTSGFTTSIDPNIVCSWKASGYLAEGEYTPLTDNILLYYYVGETVQNANLIDAGRIGEQLASHTAQVHIIDTYVNGKSGYIVYSNGYCEQWGEVPYGSDADYTGTLLKSYSNTNYQVGFTTLANNTNTYAIKWAFVAIYPITNSTFGCKSIDYERGWRAYGYLAQGEY